MMRGDERAFNEFFDSHYPGLYRFALSRLDRNADAAEEVSQAAICKAITKLATYRGEAALFTWLCTFCRHEISAWCRKNRVGAQRLDLVEDVPEVRAALESLGAQFGGPEQRFDRMEIARLVQVTLDSLPRHYGNALEWKYLEDRPVQEIAERLGLGYKAAESLLTRARGAFRDAFKTLTGADGSRSSRLNPTESAS